LAAGVVGSSCRVECVARAVDAWYSYGRGYAVKGVSLEVYEGDRVVVMGTNGAGKTTLLKLLAGMLKPSKGRVYLCGYDTREVDESLTARFIGYVPQNPWLLVFNPRVIDEIAFTAKNFGLDPAEAEASILDVATRLDIVHILNRSPYTLSEGEIRRVVLASAIVHKPKLLLLDEPTAGLDNALKDRLIETIKSLSRDYGVALVLATHDVEILPFLRDFRLVVLRDGAVAFEGSVGEALENPSVFYDSGLQPPVGVRISEKLGAYIDFYGVDPVVNLLLSRKKLRDRICR